MTPYFTPDDVKVAYESRFHFGWYAHGRASKLHPIEPVVEQTFQQVADQRNYHVLEHQIEPSVLRALLSLKPDESPANVSRFMKGTIAAAARQQSGVSQLWSRGWFVRSVGHVTNEVVRTYVDQQYEHHGASPASTAVHARYTHPGNPAELRTSNHAKFEYNVHFVFVTARRREFLDPYLAEALIEYWRQVCDKKQWIPWNIEVVWNHAHLFVGLEPSDAPGEAALSLLNNAEHFVQRRYGTALRDELESTVWQPGYYGGTVGAATTAQVKAYLAAGHDS